MKNYRIDNLQYCNWSEEIFKINHEAKLDAVHVTVVYHEDFDEFKNVLKNWDKHFKENKDLIFFGKDYSDIEKANKENKTAIFFGFQNCSPIEDDIDLVCKVHELGCRFMQLTYNNQSLLATGCYEQNDSGVTRMGKEVIKEMNRVGIVVDMSHSAEKSTFDAIKLSSKPIAITHANPSFWFAAKRNKSNELLKALAAKDNNVPFYVALPSSTIDWETTDFKNIPIEERNSEELSYVEGLDENNNIKKVLIYPKKSKAMNLAFDVTPAKYVTGLITEKGVCEASKEGLKKLFK